MCKILEKIEKPKNVTGYKVAIKNKKGTRLLSPSTGIQYKIGKIPIVRNNRKYIPRLTHWAFPSSYRGFYDERHKGHTQLFLNKKDALTFLKNTEIRNYNKYELVILKIKGPSSYTAKINIEGDDNNYCDTILISEILTLKQLKT